MGMGTILKAAAIVLIATGERKARCIERTVRRAADDAAARVVPAAAPRASRCFSIGRRRRGCYDAAGLRAASVAVARAGLGVPCSMPRSRGSMSSPIASRIESFALRRRASAFG